MMHKTKNNKEPYVSCIKINGVPILPPLISPAQRKELQKYKEQAVLLENKLKCKQIEKLLELPPTEDVKSTNNDLIDLDQSMTYVPYKNLKQRTRHLSLDIVDVIEFNPDMKNQDTILNNQDSESTSDVTDITVVVDPSSKDSKPRLLRSNSYTIENPSPILLAHLEKNKNVTTSETSFLTGKKLFPREDSLHLDLNDTSPESTYTTPLSESLCLGSQTEEKTPSLEVHQTDVIIQQITVHADANDSLFDTNITPIKQPEISNSFVDETECQLLQILKDIPENYSKQILELTQRQKSEQQKRLQSYEYIKKQLLTDNHVPNGIIKDIPVSNLSFVASTQLKKKEAEPNSVISTPSEFYTLSTSSATIHCPSSPSVKLIDLEDDDYSSSTPRANSSPNNYKTNPNISRELFPKIDAAQERKEREEWAASIIGAHVKGYLIRRLMRTHKVRSLKDTIQETLLCAVQLHNADTIDEYDIELHRRLVQQVTAACYAFHDVFFALSIRDQMKLISADRQYQLEKARRPSSSRRNSITPSSTRSSLNKKVPKPRRHSTTKA